MPSDRLRQLEIDANNAFDQFRDMYFEGGVSSVYLWDLDHGFAGMCLIYLLRVFTASLHHVLVLLNKGLICFLMS